MQPFSFLFFCGGSRLGFGFYCCVGDALIPQGCSPWNLGYFLLVQKVTKDTPRERGISIYLRAKSLASLGCAPKRACGRSPFPLDSFPLEPTKTRAAALFFDLFPGMQWEKFPQKTIEKGQPRFNRMRPKAAEHRNRHNAHRKGPTHAPTECGPKGRRAPHQTRKIDQRRRAYCTAR